MWPVPLIIGVAVVATVPILVAGVWLAVSIERKRHRKLMHQHRMSRRLSIHRPNLSADEHNYDQIPTPNSRVLRSGRPARIPAMWNSVPFEESIAPELEPDDQPVNEDPMQPNTKRRKRSSLSSYSLSLPKSRRQKKIQNTILLTQMSQSPLSAITESTDPTPADIPAVAELPTEISPMATPDRRPASPFQLQVAKTRATKTASEELEMRATERPHLARSVSMTSTLTAPTEPLPPLPTFDLYKSTRHNEPWHNSTTSLDTVGSSVLGTVLSSPSRVGTERAVPPTNLDGMQTFDFGFDEQRSSARLGVPPGRQTLQGYCRGKTGVSSIRPSVEYNGGRATSLESAYHQRLKAIDDTFKTIDASTWNDVRIQTRSASNHTRHSMQDYGSILGKRTYLENPIQQFPSLLRRPASVASGNPYQWDRKLAFSAIRLSVGSNESKKGHRRQNCVRVTNLPLPDHGNSRLLQMPEVEEEQPEPNSEQQVKIPGLTLLGAGQPVLRARASLIDVRGSPSPLGNRPILVPTRPQRPTFYRTSSTSMGLARPDSDVFSAVQSDPKTPDPFRQSARQWPLWPTPTNNIKRKSATQTLHAPYDSPTLPSPINSGSGCPRKSLVKGPRNPPPSTLAMRIGSPSPIGQNLKSNSKRTPDDLRKSIVALRSMNSEGRLLDLSSKNYCTIGEEAEDVSISLSPTMSSLNSYPYPRERRYGSAAFGASSKMSIKMSPSHMSFGGASIWEDASVRDDSPEPDMPTVPSPVLIVENTKEAQPTTPRLVKFPYPDPEAYENRAPPSVGKTWKERERDAYGLSGKYASPQEKGLGLRVGNAVFGTPGSLYDRDGFLKD